MDVKLFNLQTKKNEKIISKTKQEIKQIIISFLESLGLKIIVQDYDLENNQKSIVSVLALDEDYRLVVIEYRFGKFSRTIGTALMQIDYINKNQSQLAILITNKLGSQVVHQINYKPRLVIFADSFNYYDYDAISKLPYTIEAITYNIYQDKILFIKQFQSRAIDHVSLSYRFQTDQERFLYNEINDFILSLGDDVIEYGYQNILSYRRIKNFLSIVIDNGYYVYLKKKKYLIASEKDFEKIKDLIEKAYDGS